MNTREIINNYYQAVNSGNWNMWLTLFANDAVVEDQIAGRAQGIDALRGAVDAIRRGYSKFLMHPLHIIIENDQAAVIWHCEVANASGVPIDARGANYFQINNSKIVYMANFHDTVPFAPFINQHLTSTQS